MGCSSVLSGPGGHLYRTEKQDTLIFFVLHIKNKQTKIKKTQRCCLPVVYSSLIHVHICQGPVTSGAVSAALLKAPLQPHTEQFSLLHSVLGDEDPWIYDPGPHKHYSFKHFQEFLTLRFVVNVTLVNRVWLMMWHEYVENKKRLSQMCHLHMFHQVELCSNNIHIGAV